MTPTTPLRLEARGLRFDAVADGPEDGELVLLLHGFPQTPRCWEGVLPALSAADFRAVAPAQRGYGPGARPERASDYRLEELVADVVAMAEVLGRRAFHVVGHDFGGAVGWHLAAELPERVLSLTSLSTPHPAAYVRAALTTSQALRSLYIPFFWTPLLPELILGAGRGAVLRRMLRRTGLPAELAEDYAQGMGEPGALTAALRWYRAMRPPALRGTDGVEVPALHVWGARDPAIRGGGPRSTGDHVRGVYRYEEWDDAGHWLPELHGDRVASSVLAWLGSTPVRERVGRLGA